MRAKSIRIFKTFSGICILAVSGLLSVFVTAAAADSVCHSVPLTIVNSSTQDLSVRGSQGVAVVPAKTSTEMLFQSNHFYDKCGLIEVGFNPQSFQKGLIADSANAVQIHVEANGEMEEVGLTQPGFELNNYIAMWGLSAAMR